LIQTNNCQIIPNASNAEDKIKSGKVQIGIMKILSRNANSFDYPSNKSCNKLDYKPQIIPYEQRLARYNEARARIFAGLESMELISVIRSAAKQRSAKRCADFWKVRKQLKKAQLSSLVTKKGDVRSYAQIELFGETVSGLLDSGASISCIGGKLAKKLLESKIKLKKLNCQISTADGSSHGVTGLLATEITFRNKTKNISFYVLPELSQELYLGVDFWAAFELAPDLVGLSKTGLPMLDELEHLSPSDRDRLNSVIEKFPSFSKKGLGKTNKIEHVIDVGTNQPVKQRHYPVSPAVEKLMYAEVDRMLELGVIEESDSPWSSPVVLVRKPGKVRLCLDSRKINSLTTKDAYPLPHIEGILSRLPKASFITSLDLKDAFWQIPLERSSRPITAFVIPGKNLYQFTVMPFGLCNAPQTMSRLMDRVIPHHYETGSLYIWMTY